MIIVFVCCSVKLENVNCILFVHLLRGVYNVTDIVSGHIIYRLTL